MRRLHGACRAWHVVTLSLALVPALWANENPPAPGFDARNSDPEAIAIADRVMESMGGRANWDATRYLAWNFFGRRTHVWDRYTGDLRFEQGDLLILMNIHNKKGRVFEGGTELTDGEALAEKLEEGYRAWVNDSYWLIMPYKLKDSGVTLKLEGSGELQDGRPADVLKLTFEGVGVTPENKYHVFVGKESHLVEQWSYFPTADLEEPAFTTPWAGWQKHGKILLSGDRGELNGNRIVLTDIRVFDELPHKIFTSTEEVDLASLPPAAAD